MRVWRWLERAGGHIEGEFCRLGDWGPQGLRASKTLVCLLAMAQEGLANIRREGARVRFSSLERSGKANLDERPIVTALRARREEYREGRRRHE